MAEKVVTALITCVTEPNAEQLAGFRRFVQQQTGAQQVELKIEKDASLLGGFIIRIGNTEYDRSLKAKLNTLKAEVIAEAKKSDADARQIIPILKEEISAAAFAEDSEEIGTVQSVGDGIAVLDGLDSVMYGEIVVFESGVKGMVQDIREHTIGCILFGDDSDV